MSKNKPLILVTNDDGYFAKGINSLVESLVGLGEIVVVAPDGPRSGMSSAITSIHPIRYRVVKKEPSKNVTIYACSGTPVDCVKLGISEIVDQKPDLLVSGINHGSNASICVLYSGTMGAAIEGTLFNVPSIGFSLLDHESDANFSHTESIVRSISKEILEKGLATGICLNVNIPHSKDELKGIKVSRQAKGQWVEEFKKTADGGNNEVFWLTGRFNNYEPENKDTDEWALANGYASIVPIQVDMTAQDHVEAMRSLEDLF